MSCLQQDCQVLPEVMCKLCSKTCLFCGKHGMAHSTNFRHKLESIDEDTLAIFTSLALKSEIKKCILQITNETLAVINQIKSASFHAISNLKNLNRTIRRLRDFKIVKYEKNKIDFILSQATLLCYEMKNFIKIKLMKGIS